MRVCCRAGEVSGLWCRWQRSRRHLHRPARRQFGILGVLVLLVLIALAAHAGVDLETPVDVACFCFGVNLVNAAVVLGVCPALSGLGVVCAAGEEDGGEDYAVNGVSVLLS